MKKILLILTLCITLCACGNTTKSIEETAAETIETKSEEEVIQEYMAQGQILMENGDYNGAIEKFKLAGDSADPFIKKCYKEEFKKAIKKAEKEKVVEHFEKEFEKVVITYKAVCSDYFGSTEYVKLVSEAAVERVEFIYSNSLKMKDYPFYELERYLKVLEKLNSTQDISDDAVQKVKDLYHTSYGLWLLSIIDRNKSNEEEMIDHWSQCSQESDGQLLLESFYLAKNGEISKAIEQAETIFSETTYIDEYDYQLAKYAEDNSFYSNINELFLINKILYNGDKYTQNKNGEITKSFETKYAILAGIDGLSGDLEINTDLLKELKKICGINANNKVLILYRGKEFKTNKSIYMISTSLIDNLPQEYYPETLEEVEYVIFIDVSFTRTGRFQYTGATRILEKAVVSLYTVEKKTPIWKSDVIYGEQDDTMEYSLYYIPEYYSESSPDIKESLIKATEIIEELSEDITRSN